MNAHLAAGANHGDLDGSVGIDCLGLGRLVSVRLWIKISAEAENHPCKENHADMGE